jgi:hypothetical protein
MTAPSDHRHGLRETQEWLARRILDGGQLGSAADGVLITPPDGNLAARLHAYADGYPARLREALSDTFPAVMHLIGEQQAIALTSRYIAAHPPRSFNLNHAGNALVDFLRDDDLTATLPFLPDLAALEWRMARAFHAEELPPLDPAQLAEWDPESWPSAVLRFQPAVAVVSSPWPLRALHAARDTPLEEIDLDLRDRPDDVLVRRHGLAVHCDGIEAAQAQALARLLAGETLGAVMQQLADRDHDPEAVGGWFSRWMQVGLIVEARLQSASITARLASSTLDE